MRKKVINYLETIDFIKMIRNYKLEFLKKDFLAALSVAVIALPQNMAYALIVGVNPIYGIYTSVVSMILGTIFSVSNYMVVGPTNIVAMAIASNLSFLGSSNYLQVVLLLTFLVGLFQLIFGILKLGNLVNYVSHPVIVGLTTGAALLIGVGQLQNLLGISVESGVNLFTEVYALINNLNQINGLAFSLGLLTIAIIIIIKQLKPELPAYLLALVVATMVVYFFNLGGDISVIGNLPTSIPKFSMISFSVPQLWELITKSISIALLGLIQTLAIVKSLATKSGEEVEVNQEFIGQGIINIGCSFFSSFATAGSFTNSFANYQAGAKTRLSEFFVAISIVLFIILFNPIIQYVPIVALASLVIVVSASMIDFGELEQIFSTTKGDALIFASTFIATIAAPSIDYAIYFGILVSVIVVLKESSNINLEVMHYKEDDDELHETEVEDIDRYIETGKIDEDGFIVINLNGSLHFSSADNLKDNLNQLLNKGENFVFRMRHIERIDVTVIRELNYFIAKVHNQGGIVKISGVNKEQYGLLDNVGIIDKIGEENIFLLENEILGSTRQAMDSTDEK
ncbi:MAG: SulP family inorganic anion transporter [Bacillota bacterium]